MVCLTSAPSVSKTLFKILSIMMIRAFFFLVHDTCLFSLCNTVKSNYNISLYSTYARSYYLDRTPYHRSFLVFKLKIEGEIDLIKSLKKLSFVSCL